MYVFVCVCVCLSVCLSVCVCVFTVACNNGSLLFSELGQVTTTTTTPKLRMDFAGHSARLLFASNCRHLVNKMGFVICVGENLCRDLCAREVCFSLFGLKPFFREKRFYFPGMTRPTGKPRLPGTSPSLPSSQFSPRGGPRGQQVGTTP